MRVTVRLFAGLRELAGRSSLELEDVASVADVWPRLGLGDEPAGLLYAVNREYVSTDRALADGDEVALIPPVSGGSFRLIAGAARRRRGAARGRVARRRRDRELRRDGAPPLPRPRRAPSRLRGVRGDGGGDARAARRRADRAAWPDRGRDPPPARPRRDRRAERRRSRSRRRIARRPSTRAARRSRR